jgi:hypothetical protein
VNWPASKGTPVEASLSVLRWALAKTWLLDNHSDIPLAAPFCRHNVPVAAPFYPRLTTNPAAAVKVQPTRKPVRLLRLPYGQTNNQREQLKASLTQYVGRQIRAACDPPKTSHTICPDGTATYAQWLLATSQVRRDCAPPVRYHL